LDGNQVTSFKEEPTLAVEVDTVKVAWLLPTADVAFAAAEIAHLRPNVRVRADIIIVKCTK
jgi:hypothetical protein